MHHRYKVFGSSGRRKRRRLLIERLTDRRVLASISGMVFEDSDVTLRPEAAETGLAQRLVYLDENDNGQLDGDERVARTEEDGSFSFDGVEDGPQVVRLFNGTSTQTPTFPLQAGSTGSPIPLTDPIQTLSTAQASWTLTPESVVVADLESGDWSSITVGAGLKRMAPLTDGKLLVIGGDDEGPTAWLVDPQLEQTSPAEIAGADMDTPWADLAVDADGQGLLLRQSSEGSVVYGLDASTEEGKLSVTATGVELPDGAQLLSSDSGQRSVVAWPGDDGLDMALWSNPTATVISDPPVSVPGTTELLAFDDASGLLVARSDTGGVSVFDVDADFAPLHELAEVTGPVALDGSREILFTISPSGDELQLIDLRDGLSLAELDVDLSSLGDPAALIPQGQLDGLIMVGSSGLNQVAFERPAAHRLAVTDGQSPPAVRFGVHVAGENAPPTFDSIPSWSVREDHILDEPAPAALEGAVDADDDALVLVQTGAAANGTATVTATGAIHYVPGPDFEGTDTVPVMLHDGRAGTSAELEIVVTPAPDPITGISPESGSVPENAVGDVIAELDVEGRDGEGFYQFTVDDPRFEVEFGELRLVEGEALDYEQEQEVVVELTVTDLVHGDSFTQPFTVNVIDAPEQPQSIGLTGDSVVELRPGDVVGEVTVDGIVPSAGVAFTVNDDRFEIASSTLKLADGVWVELRDQEEIQLVISAQDAGQVHPPQEAPFIIEVLENSTPFHNEDEPYDVNDDGDVTALDALLIVNYLNTYGPGEVGFGDPGYGYDVNGDGAVTALDALLIVNELNQLESSAEAVGGEGGEGERWTLERDKDSGPLDSAPKLRLLDGGEPVSPAGPRRSLPEENELTDEALRTFDPPPAQQADGDDIATLDQTLRLFSHDA